MEEGRPPRGSLRRVLKEPARGAGPVKVPPRAAAKLSVVTHLTELLGEGGFGTVFAGHRRDNNLKRKLSTYQWTVPLEVALMLKLRPAAEGTSTVVTLLDWYDIDLELILVLERPVPCMDLVEFINSKDYSLPEHEAKTITTQLVEALIEVHSRGVFHRDIKLDNILIETGSDVPRVRLIDLGRGTLLSEGTYSTAQGSCISSVPWFLHRCYSAEPTTVWQLGVVLFALLHGRLPFRGRHSKCNAFLLSCLEKSPEDRPTLEELNTAVAAAASNCPRRLPTLLWSLVFLNII
uniref:non-specific serine/threonine protein kinase n=1 Tax=Cyclopterus lumpus TaxID=8103 RepID=A0A8C2XNP0_CYCLU